MAATNSIRIAQPAQTGPSGQLLVFMACVLTPIAFHVGGLLLSPTRLLLLATLVPAMGMVLSGKAGRVTAVDWLFIFHGLWIVIALVANHGGPRLAYAAISMVEVTGGYFLGRLLIRDRAQFHWFLRIALIFLIVMLPLTVHELITGRQLLNETLGKVFETPMRGGSAYGRLGLERVYSVFDHPILFGVFSAMLVTNVFFMLAARGAVTTAAITGLFLLFNIFASLSSAPLLAFALQAILLTWNVIMKGQWRLFATLFAIFYVALDLASNRTPITIMLDTLTFNPQSAWIRVGIFEYGWAAVKANPIFGVGFNDYPKPHWLTNSVDNYWLVVALRYGMVGAGLLIGAYLMHMRLIAKAVLASPVDQKLRLGYMISLLAVSLSLVTVHMWGNASVIIMFFIGGGAWLYTTDLSDEDGTEGDDDRSGGRPQRVHNRAQGPAGPRYTRFGPGTARPVPVSARDRARA